MKIDGPFTTRKGLKFRRALLLCGALAGATVFALRLMAGG